VTYQPKTYRKQGGDELVVASSGKITVESGGQIDIESGGYLAKPIQTLTTTQTATAVTNYGVSYLSASTTGPTYTLAAPVAGTVKSIVLNPSSSGATHRCVVNTNSTDTSVNMEGHCAITLATSALQSVTLLGITSSAWRVASVYTTTMGGFGAQST